MIRKYRKLPLVIEAVQWDGTNIKEISEFLGVPIHQIVNLQASLRVENQFGSKRFEAYRYDFIIKGIKGEFYPCSPDIFVDSYEPVKEEK